MVPGSLPPAGGPQQGKLLVLSSSGALVDLLAYSAWAYACSCQVAAQQLFAALLCLTCSVHETRAAGAVCGGCDI